MPFPILLDSGGYGRYSFVGMNPFLTVWARGRTMSLRRSGEVRATLVRGDPFSLVKGLISAYPVAAEDGLPPFLGGVAGYWSYDLGRLLESIPRQILNDLKLPQLRLAFYGEIIAFDHASGIVYLLATGYPEKEPIRAEQRAMEGLTRLEAILRVANPLGKSRSVPRKQEVLSTFTPGGYCRAVETVKEYIAAGDIFQANLTQRFSTPLGLAPLDFYRRLREVNPAPWGGYFAFPEGILVSASPERFLRVFRDGTIETIPIKGTRPRGKTSEEDIKLGRQLLESAKDRAELIMIVDLERNDLGKVCTTGSVRVPNLGVLGEHPTVFHLSASVTGELRPEFSAVDALKALFPGGSITGAPKVRAMEIIEELEPVRRGPYTGAFGYLSFSGEADLNVAIRIALLQKGRAFFHAGGGVVADSEPQGEYAESLDKAGAIAQALGCRWPDGIGLDSAGEGRRGP